MKRLVVVLVVLAIVLIAVAAEIKRNPEGSREAQLNRLTPAQHVQLEQAKHEFMQTRGRLLRMRDEGAPKAEVQAQEKKLEEVSQKVIAIGGVESLRELGEQNRQTRRGSQRGMGRRGGRRGGGGMAPLGRRPGGPVGERAPAEGSAGPSRGQ